VPSGSSTIPHGTMTTRHDGPFAAPMDHGAHAHALARPEPLRTCAPDGMVQQPHRGVAALSEFVFGIGEPGWRPGQFIWREQSAENPAIGLWRKAWISSEAPAYP